MINDRCGAVYYPCEDLSVDEFLVLLKGRIFFKQYKRTKRSRFGIKFYKLCIHNGITLEFNIYHVNIEDGLINPQGNNWLLTGEIPLTLPEPYLERAFMFKIKFIHFLDIGQLTKKCISTYVQFVTIHERVKLTPED